MAITLALLWVPISRAQLLIYDFGFPRVEIPHAYCFLLTGLKLLSPWRGPCLGCEVPGFLLVPGVRLPVHLVTLLHLDC